MPARFFSDQPVEGAEVVLAGPEAHHLIDVRRLLPGQEVVVFDGRGDEFRARIGRIERHRVELLVLERIRASRERPWPITLGVALPKGDRQRWLVEKSVELGVSRVVPLITQRGVAQPTGSSIKRLERNVIEASKQCGRNTLMQVDPPQQAIDWLAIKPSGTPGHIADLQASGPPAAPVGHQPVWLAVGPEGGWTPPERQAAAQAGWQTVQLGPRTLRVETAALVLVCRASASWP